MRAWSVTIALLLIAGGVAATTSQDHAELEASRCWSCHGEGLWSPPMEAPRIDRVAIDDGHLTLRVANTWTHDIQRLVAVVHASDALQVTTTQDDAVSRQSGEFVPGGATSQTLSVSPSNFAQGLDIRVVTSNPVQTDLTIEAVAPDGSVFGATTATPGEDVVRINALDLALSGSGAWDVVVSRASAIGSADFQLTATSLAEPADGVWVKTHADTILPGEADQFQFDVAPGTAPVGDVTLQLFSIVYYDHLPPTPEIEDLDRLVSTVQLQVETLDGSLGLVTAPGLEALDEEASGLGVAALASTIGLLGIMAARRR